MITNFSMEIFFFLKKFQFAVLGSRDSVFATSPYSSLFWRVAAGLQWALISQSKGTLTESSNQ